MDAERLQCSVDADCAARGFESARCEGSLCVPAGPTGEGVPLAAAPTGSADRAGAEELVIAQRPGLSAPTVRPPEPGASAVSSEASQLATYSLLFEPSRRSGVQTEELGLRLCALADESCGGGVPLPAVTDPAAGLQLELDAGFRGYLEVSAPNLTPTLIFLPSPALIESAPVLYRLLGPIDLDVLLRQGSLPQDADHGFAIALVLDATGQRSEGGQLSLGAATDGSPQKGILYYYRDGLPTQQAESTDEQGAGGWSQLAVGLLRAEARRTDGGGLPATAAFWSRPGHVSIIPLSLAVGP